MSAVVKTRGGGRDVDKDEDDDAIIDAQIEALEDEAENAAVVGVEDEDEGRMLGNRTASARQAPTSESGRGGERTAVKVEIGDEDAAPADDAVEDEGCSVIEDMEMDEMSLPRSFVTRC